MYGNVLGMIKPQAGVRHARVCVGKGLMQHGKLRLCQRDALLDQLAVGFHLPDIAAAEDGGRHTGDGKDKRQRKHGGCKLKFIAEFAKACDVWHAEVHSGIDILRFPEDKSLQKGAADKNLYAGFVQLSNAAVINLAPVKNVQRDLGRIEAGIGDQTVIMP